MTPVAKARQVKAANQWDSRLCTWPILSRDQYKAVTKLYYSLSTLIHSPSYTHPLSITFPLKGASRTTVLHQSFYSHHTTRKRIAKRKGKARHDGTSSVKVALGSEITW